MNFLVCTVFVIGSLAAGHTIRYKREISHSSESDNEIQTQESSQTPQVTNANYDDGQGRVYDSGVAVGQDQGRISHITITKEIPIHQLVPVPVEVEKKVPHPIYVDVPVAVDQPYYVKIHRPYPVPIYKDIPFTVYKDIPVPVKVAVEVPYPVKVPVLVPQPIPIPIDIPIHVPIPELKVIKRPIVLEHQERENGGGDYVGNGASGVRVEVGDIGASNENGGVEEPINYASNGVNVNAELTSVHSNSDKNH